MKRKTEKRESAESMRSSSQDYYGLNKDKFKYKKKERHIEIKNEKLKKYLHPIFQSEYFVKKKNDEKCDECFENHDKGKLSTNMSSQIHVILDQIQPHDNPGGVLAGEGVMNMVDHDTV